MRETTTPGRPIRHRLVELELDVLSQDKAMPFLPSDMIEGGLCLLGQSNTQKSIWLDFASLDAYSGALGFRPHAVA